MRGGTAAARRHTCRPGPWTALLVTALCLGALVPASAQGTPWDLIAPLFTVPDRFVDQFGPYRSPLVFPDGTPVRTAADWERRRQQLLAEWHDLMGAWPPLVANPRVEILGESRGETFRQQRVRLEVAPGQRTEGWLLSPAGSGPFPAVFVPFYEPETMVGLKERPERDFARQLTRAGFVTLSIGTPAGDAWAPDRGGIAVQPLSYYAYVAANACTALAALPDVDASRIGVVGHSYGGKWALFAGALWERFAAVATSDPGIVFDETRPNVNYWEPWYLGYDPRVQRPARGLPTADNPRTGPYKTMIETGRDLHELHALIAPCPFFVSGGSEDPPERWIALNHAVAVNRLLGFSNRVGMSNRPTHDPTPESNAQLVAFFEHFLSRPATAEPRVERRMGRTIHSQAQSSRRSRQ
jgi:dienelactone hydrolase